MGVFYSYIKIFPGIIWLGFLCIYSQMCIIPDTWCCCCIFGGWPNVFCPKTQIKKPRITGFWIKIIGDLSNTPARIPLNEILHLIYDPRHNVFMWFVFYVIVSGSVTIPLFLYVREKKRFGFKNFLPHISKSFENPNSG